MATAPDANDLLGNMYSTNLNNGQVKSQTTKSNPMIAVQRMNEQTEANKIK